MNMTTKYLQRYCTLSLLLSTTIAFAQEGGPVIYPTPQQAVFQPGAFVHVESLDLQKLQLETDLNALLANTFKLAASEHSTPLQISKLKAPTFRSGAYQLNIGACSNKNRGR